MNWLEFVILAVAGLMLTAVTLAMLLFSLWIIKLCCVEIARTVVEFVTWVSRLKTKFG